MVMICADAQIRLAPKVSSIAKVKKSIDFIHFNFEYPTLKRQSDPLTALNQKLSQNGDNYPGQLLDKVYCPTAQRVFFEKLCCEIKTSGFRVIHLANF